ncbi:NADP-binding protein [Dacryopinax primogenitus]|uniref:D-xylose 1-dehydrogenase (NADP(+), D-xylono-1,5-lactone-forming) n=1 Tax=Dacryopinax primogenitus (strain DJM 731) TaxID=1858805 RepID=M5G5Q9_DACPD|nr:NADP-binding protein [Dacryopinax primogenitus]EJU03550.1 NADP-binding protein [Dacryopinax primogenitus]
MAAAVQAVLGKQPITIRWGVIGAGWISGCFVRDIVLDPKTRGVEDVIHTFAAVGSRDVAKGREFAEKNAPHSTGVKVYGSYEEVAADPEVDAIYVGTPHTYHYEHSMISLKGGKHVLCEKPVTSNAAEFKALVAFAKEKNLFFMEAMWTRFQPVAEFVKQIVAEDKLGPVRLVTADLAGDFKLDQIPKTHRILDPKLGGGALLDLGPYPFVWLIISLFEYPKNQNRRPTSITGAMMKTPLTGVDQNTVIVLDFDHIPAQAILSCSINLPSSVPAVHIRCANGTISIDPPIYKPSTVVVQEFAPGTSNVIREEKRVFKFEGGGWHFQADEVARCIRDGKISSDVWTLEKTLFEMEVFDEVRKQGKYTFPPGVEKVTSFP